MPATRGSAIAGETLTVSYTATFDNAVDNSSNRIVLAYVYYNENNANLVSSVTCGATALTKIDEVTPTFYSATGYTARFELWYAAAPENGATGVTVTFQDVQTDAEGFCTAVWLDDAKQTLAAEDILTQVTHDTLTSSLEVTTDEDGSYVVAAISDARAGNIPAPSGGQTPLESAGNLAGTSGALAYEEFVTAKTENDTWNSGGSTILRGGHIAVIVEPPGPVTSTVHNTLDTIVRKTTDKTYTINATIAATVGDLNYTLDSALLKTLSRNYSVDALIETGFSGYAIDAVINFEGEETLTYTTDAILQTTTQRDYTLDFWIVNAPYKQYNIDAILHQEGVATYTVDSHIVKHPTLTYSTDAVLIFGPNIDVYIGELMQKWHTDYVTLTMYSSSREYVRVGVYAIESGEQVDPTSYTSYFAATQPDESGDIVEPEDADWVQGGWETDDTTSDPVYYATILIGKDATIPLADGTYYIFWKIAANTEAPVRLVRKVVVK